MINFPRNVRLLSTQRFFEGGKSSGSFENFNLALHVNDSQDRVLENRKITHLMLKVNQKWLKFQQKIIKNH